SGGRARGRSVGGDCRLAAVAGHSSIKQPDAQQRRRGQRERGLHQRQGDGAALQAERQGQRRESFEEGEYSLRGEGEHVDEVIKVVEILEQAFHGSSLARTSGRSTGEVPDAASARPR